MGARRVAHTDDEPGPRIHGLLPRRVPRWRHVVALLKDDVGVGVDYSDSGASFPYLAQTPSAVTTPADVERGVVLGGLAE